MPKRIQRKRSKGWKMPAGAVYVGRPSKFGNPYNTAETFSWWLHTPRPPGDVERDTILGSLDELK